MRGNQLQRCQQEAEQVTEILRDSYTTLLDRGGALRDLDERADQLRKQSSTFAKITKPLAKKKLWKTGKGMLLLGLAVMTAVAIILAIIM